MIREQWSLTSIITVCLVTILACTGNSPNKNAATTVDAINTKTVESAVDLRGPLDPKGRIVQEETLFKMSEMALTTSVMGQEIKGKISMVGNSLDQTEVLASDTTGPTRVRVRILRETVETTTVMAGQTEKEEERDPLDGQTVIGSKAAGRWSFTLEKGEPTVEQATALGALAIGFGEERTLYPADKTSIGQSWTIPGNYFARVFGADDIELSSASGDATFKDIVEYKGRRHALIEITMKFEGREKESDLNVVLSVSGAYYRDLTHYVDVDASLKGNATYSGIVTQQGMNIQMNMTGPVFLSYSQRLVE